MADCSPFMVFVVSIKLQIAVTASNAIIHDKITTFKKNLVNFRFLSYNDNIMYILQIIIREGKNDSELKKNKNKHKKNKRR
jgi:hypothetical protein